MEGAVVAGVVGIKSLGICCRVSRLTTSEHLESMNVTLIRPSLYSDSMRARYHCPSKDHLATQRSPTLQTCASITQFCIMVACRVSRSCGSTGVGACLWFGVDASFPFSRKKDSSSACLALLCALRSTKVLNFLLQMRHSAFDSIWGTGGLAVSQVPEMPFLPAPGSVVTTTGPKP